MGTKSAISNIAIEFPHPDPPAHLPISTPNPQTSAWATACSESGGVHAMAVRGGRGGMVRQSAHRAPRAPIWRGAGGVGVGGDDGAGACA